MRKAFLAFCLTAAALLGGCDNGREAAVSAPPHMLEVPTEAAPAPQLETCSFSDGLERFIECYNSCCEAYGNANLLNDAGWSYSDDCWHYRQYENIWTEPELRVFVEASGSIREIRIGFEDHGYTAWGEALSEERAFYSLRCLCDDQSDEELNQLIAEARSDMKEAANYAARDEEPEMKHPLACGDYELYQFFSGGVYYLCIRDG